MYVVRLLTLGCSFHPGSLVHLYLAVRALYIGLALDSLTQWVAWQAVPPDCPNCKYRLRPAMPSLPWFRRREAAYARLLVDDEENRYRDDEGEASHAAEPEVEAVVSRDRKGKASTVVLAE